VASWQETASRCAVTGAIAVWGAGAKGATFCNLVDPDVQLISCVVDINPTKQGRFIAGTGHPIVSPYELTTRCPGFVFVLNPNYTHEIARDLASRSIQATVYDLMASVK
ncbi:MAG: methyltransferase, partial [Planctomycetes bacterium]|nr:methyltransferase [Planctomycetota bacterium]